MKNREGHFVFRLPSLKDSDEWGVHGWVWWGDEDLAKTGPVEDNSQKIQGGKGQEKSGSHPLDEFLKGFEGSLL